MFWMAIGASSFIAVIALLVVFTKRPKQDLGSVSAHWVMTHRVDSH